MAAVNQNDLLIIIRHFQIVEQRSEENQELKTALKRKQSIPILDQESKGVNKAFEADEVTSPPPVTTLQTEDKTQRKLR